jgi:hypothetical protein
MCKGKRKAVSKMTAVLLTMMMAVTFIPTHVFASQMQAQGLSGAGTADDPYLIGTEAELLEFAELAKTDEFAGCAVLTKDIVLSSDWVAMKPSSGTVTKAYSGTFDGANHTIKNVNISGSGQQGFFALVRGGTVKNLMIEGTVSSTNNAAGGIVGSLIFGTIENCSFRGSVSTSTSASNGDAGGITGYAGYSGNTTNRSSVSGCSNYGTITGKYAGGIAGRTKWGTIENSYNAGTISGLTRSGGITGQALNTITLSNLYSVGTNNGSSSTKADIIDFVSQQTTITNCHYKEKLKGNDYGNVNDCGTITDAETLLSNLGSAYAADTNNINSGYPILAWEAGSAPQPKDPKIKINGNTNLYLVNSGAPKTSDLSITYIDMDDTPAVTWTVTEGTDLISIQNGDTEGVITVTPLKPGKAKIKAETDGGTYSDEAEILVYPFITGIAMEDVAVVGETYTAKVSTYGGKPYDFENYPELKSFTWKYYDATTGNTGETTITGKGNAVELPAAAAGKYLSVVLNFNGSDIYASPRKEILAARVPVTGVTIEGAAKVGEELTAEAGTSLKAVAEGQDGQKPTKAVYQWAEKKGDDFVDIAGATNQTFKVPGSSDAVGKEYRVTVTGDLDSSVTSEPVKITDIPTQTLQDEAVLKEVAGKYDYGKLTPKYGKNDNNAAKYLEADIAAKGYEDVTVEIKSVEKRSYPNGGIAAIAGNGDITWFYPNEGDDPTDVWTTPYMNEAHAMFDVTFVLKKGDAEVTLEKPVDINWDTEKLCKYLKEEILDQLTWDTIKGENEQTDAVKTDLSLPVYPKNVDTKLISFTWTSDNTDGISVKDPQGDASTVAYADRIGKVSRGMEDKDVKLTATIKYNKTNDIPEVDAAIAALSKDFEITVPAYTQEEIEEMVTNDLNQKIDSAMETTGLTDCVTGEPVDLDNVTGDIHFPTTRDLKIDGSVQPVTITSDNTDVIDYPRDKADPTKPQKNAARVYVYRPLPGSEPQQVTVTMTITDTETGVAVSRDFKVTVKPLTEEELNDAKAFMTAAVNGYWTGLKGTNTDPENVSDNLMPFQEIRQGEDGSLTFAYDVNDVKGGGIVPHRYVEELTGADSDYRRFNLSDNKYIADDTLTLADNLPEEGAQVTIDSYLNHEVYAEYYLKYKEAGNNEAAELFKPFYRQHAEVTITIKGPHIHKLVHYDAKAATTAKAGNKEYWFCAGCGKYFADEDGTKELTKAEITVPKKAAATTKPAKPAKKGTTLKSGKNKYTVTSASAKNPTVAVKSTTAAGTLTIPATVKVKGVTYKVTSIKAKAFFKNKKLKKVTVGKNIKTIGSQAFSKCTKLKTVTIGAGVTKIGTKCFSGTKKLKTLTVKSKKLTKKGVKGSLKGSKIKTVKVKVGTKKVNKKYVKKYKKIFTKKNCGKKVKVK